MKVIFFIFLCASSFLSASENVNPNPQIPISRGESLGQKDMVRSRRLESSEIKRPACRRNETQP